MVASYARNLPDISRMADYQPASSTHIYARDGSLLAAVYKENRVWVPIGRSPIVRDAFVANEDQHFYRAPRRRFRRHRARRDRRLSRTSSFKAPRRSPSSSRGGSSSTNRSPCRARSRKRSSRSRSSATTPRTRSSSATSTSSIFGRRVRRASRGAHVLRRRRRELTLAQAAMLAGIVAGAVGLLAVRQLALRAQDRQRHVLERMVESGYITRQRRCRLLTTLGLIGEAPDRSAVDTAIRTSRRTSMHRSNRRSGASDVRRRPTSRYDARSEDAADGARARSIGALRRRRPRGSTRTRAALVAIRPSTGEILAMVGGAGFSLDNQFNRAWQARRQPGSSFKVYVYTAAIDSGIPPSRSSTIRRLSIRWATARCGRR